MLPPDDVRVFIAAVRFAGFSAAAEHLGLTRSAVSRRIEQLESRLGVRLIRRTTRHFSLTEPGQLFYERGATAIATLDELESGLLEEYANPRGDLRINCAVMVGLKLVIPRMEAFKVAHPDLRIHIDLSDAPVRRNETQHDLYIRFGKVEDPNLVSSLLARSGRILCASPSYIAKHGTPSSMDELKQHSCLLISGLGSHYNDWVFQGSDNFETFRASGNLIFNSGDGHYEALIAGLGIGRVTEILARNDIDSGRLIPVLTHIHSSASEPIHALFHGDKRSSKKIRAITEYLREQLKRI